MKKPARLLESRRARYAKQLAALLLLIRAAQLRLRRRDAPDDVRWDDVTVEQTSGDLTGAPTGEDWAADAPADAEDWEAEDWEAEPEPVPEPEPEPTLPGSWEATLPGDWEDEDDVDPDHRF